MTNEKTTKIYYGMYDIDFAQIHIRNSGTYIIPQQFVEFIKRFAKNKWRWKYQSRKFPFILFTVGVDGDIQALSIVHEKERHISYEKGKDIVEGRLNRQLGLLNRPTYDKIPLVQYHKAGEEFIETLEYKEVPPYIITGD